MSAKCLNSNALPSMTGMAPLGPILPSPRTAEPSDITATRLLVQVYTGISDGSSAIALDTAATPGV